MCSSTRLQLSRIVTALQFGLLLTFAAFFGANQRGEAQHIESKPQDRDLLAALDEPDAPRAIALWDKFLQKEPSHTLALTEIARRYNDIGRHKLAMDRLQAPGVWKCRSCIPHAHFEMARAHFGQNQFADAREHLDQALDFLVPDGSPDSAHDDIRQFEVLELQAWLFFGMRQHQKAIEQIDRSIQSSDGNFAPRLSRSAMLICLGRGSEAGRDAIDLLNVVDTIDDSVESSAILGYVGFQRDLRKTDADRLKQQISERARMLGSSIPRFDCLSSGKDAKSLYEVAKRNDAVMTDVQCILGLRLTSEGNRDAAKTHLDWVVKQGRRDSPMYRIGISAAQNWPEANVGSSLKVQRPPRWP